MNLSNTNSKRHNEMCLFLILLLQKHDSKKSEKGKGRRKPHYKYSGPVDEKEISGNVETFMPKHVLVLQLFFFSIKLLFLKQPKTNRGENRHTTQALISVPIMIFIGLNALRIPLWQTITFDFAEFTVVIENAVGYNFLCKSLTRQCRG